jgi:sulfite exporter TauE/SafE
MLYALGFVGGLAGSVHCPGMCGGFTALLAGTSPDPVILPKALAEPTAPAA